MGGVRERSGKRGLAVSFNGNPGLTSVETKKEQYDRVFSF